MGWHIHRVHFDSCAALLNLIAQIPKPPTRDGKRGKPVGGTANSSNNVVNLVSGP